MKKFGRTAALAVSTAALASGVFATPATAAQVGIDQATSNTISVHTRGDGTPAPAQLGDPEEWGVVEVTIPDAAEGSVTPMKIVEVGGGTWSYGWQARDNYKYCYSNYYHGSVKHGSTVNMAGYIIKDTKPAGQTSNAHHTAGLAYTCYTYYAKY
ncbi:MULTISPECIES: lactococcin 972 family bacteriocin [Streptomyces]|uniref:lactococcin 972 family bacteriocin n=1 Tax=Streptomyces TaxID=1883 RepID=UPI000F5BBD4C|nr:MULTISPECIES: lactococcin 972 family bacteriocin [Streptomyces]WSG54143.1 lactococcin 972 family bacteriocin [Streptomyces sp. NBC_01732]WSX04774.1 lactococcin 972 family bacteriocin [Streptomyces sp. NBC_00987]MCT2547037.1 lactococcin 972 family bacteriocin [Streptomyces atratus]MCX4392932.1 lactococcin 972 family bacteriocin [Streptomyces sp. NBC_01767]MCX5105059.1 lactococcin 972 family bacteriocin [Streptomyces sp. NBC_00439]